MASLSIHFNQWCVIEIEIKTRFVPSVWQSNESHRFDCMHITGTRYTLATLDLIKLSFINGFPFASNPRFFFFFASLSLFLTTNELMHLMAAKLFTLSLWICNAFVFFFYSTLTLSSSLDTLTHPSERRWWWTYNLQNELSKMARHEEKIKLKLQNKTTDFLVTNTNPCIN